MHDLRDQIQSYAELLDAAAPPAIDLAPRTLDFRPAPTGRRALDKRVAAAVLVSAAALVIVAIGGIALLRGGEDTDVVGSTAPTTATTPPVETTVTTTAAPAPVRFVGFGPDVVVEHGDEGKWDSPFTGPGAVVFHEGRFHMFRNGYGEEMRGSIGYLVSDDAVSWDDPTDDPLFDVTAVPYADGYVFARSAVVDRAGMWVLYLEVSLPDDAEVHDDDPRVIGRATAPAPTGPWTVDPAPVLTGGEQGAWDEKKVLSPSVVATADGFVMYYIGVDAGGVGAVGSATSTDGVTWRKDEGPVLVASQAWERGGLIKVDAELVAGTWVLLYSGDTPSRRGIATGTDGVTFTKLDTNPVLDTTSVSRGGIFDTELVHANDRWHVLVENGGGRSTKAISLLVYEGPLLPG